MFTNTFIYPKMLTNEFDVKIKYFTRRFKQQ